MSGPADLADTAAAAGVVRHRIYGAALPGRGWVPALRYALRRDRVLTLVADLPRGRLLEVGCGAGALLDDMARLGFSCAGFETSGAALELASRLLAGRPGIGLHRAPGADWREAFDVLLSCEVLEHVEDDAAALRLWRSWLRPGGSMVLSVPAHAARWGPGDVWAGHYRRYERPALLDLLRASGFTVEHHECYGFPLSNLTESLGGWLRGRAMRRAERAADAPLDRAASTARSGTQRGLETRLYAVQASRPGSALFRMCCRMQEKTLRHELGTGYLIRVRRS